MKFDFQKFTKSEQAIGRVLGSLGLMYGLVSIAGDLRNKIGCSKHLEFGWRKEFEF
jgi:hypothetical protein